MQTMPPSNRDKMRALAGLTVRHQPNKLSEKEVWTSHTANQYQNIQLRFKWQPALVHCTTNNNVPEALSKLTLLQIPQAKPYQSRFDALSCNQVKSHQQRTIPATPKDKKLDQNLQSRQIKAKPKQIVFNGATAKIKCSTDRLALPLQLDSRI